MIGWKKIRRLKFLLSVVRSYNGTKKGKKTVLSIDSFWWWLERLEVTWVAEPESSLWFFLSLFSVDNESLESTDVCGVVFSRIFSVVCADQKHLAFQQLWQSFKRGGWGVHVWNDAAKAFLGYTRIRSYIPQKGRVRSQELKFSSSLKCQNSSSRKIWKLNLEKTGPPRFCIGLY